jgi:hypothetical protein
MAAASKDCDGCDVLEHVIVERDQLADENHKLRHAIEALCFGGPRPVLSRAGWNFGPNGPYESPSDALLVKESNGYN